MVELVNTHEDQKFEWMMPCQQTEKKRLPLSVSI